MQCKICTGKAVKFCEKDFTHENLTPKKKEYKAVFDYYLCTQCHLCFCPEIMSWKPDKFASLIYNKEYSKVDPGFSGLRASGNSDGLRSKYNPFKGAHLDFGGGSKGLLSQSLSNKGWNSKTYDPFGKQSFIGRTEKFDLITSFEVFEHTTDPVEMLDKLTKLLASNGEILFSTEVHDKELDKDWWYLNARAGHIALYSTFTLEVLATKFNLKYVMHNHALHSFIKD